MNPNSKHPKPKKKTFLNKVLRFARKDAGASLERDIEYDPWDLDRPILNWSEFDVFTLRQAMEAVLIFGEIGAAKSTGSVARLLLAYLALRMGGLFNCVKPGDAELIRYYARLMGCEDMLIIVSPQNHWRCNLLDYLVKRPGVVGSKVEQVVALIMTVVEATRRGQRSGANNDGFFQDALRQLLRNAVEVCIAAHGTVTMSLLHQVIMSAPRTADEVHSRAWQETSTCFQLIELAESKERQGRAQKDFELAAGYFLQAYPDMPPETRGSILATYGVIADTFLRGQMADLFDGETNFIPELTYNGAIIVLDLPIKVYGPAGLAVQTAFTHLWQTAAESRDLNQYPRPIWWVADEAQELINEYTSRFLAVSRSQRIASILISQNISNYLAALGGPAGKDHVEATLGNAGTKIFHANGHSQTNKWASDMISDEIQTRQNYRGSQEEGKGGGGGSDTVGKKVLPAVFTMLKKGGPLNGFLTEAIVYRTGAEFRANDDQPYLRTVFAQQVQGVTWNPK